MAKSGRSGLEVQGKRQCTSARWGSRPPPTSCNRIQSTPAPRRCCRPYPANVLSAPCRIPPSPQAATSTVAALTPRKYVQSKPRNRTPSAMDAQWPAIWWSPWACAALSAWHRAIDNLFVSPNPWLGASAKNRAVVTADVSGPAWNGTSRKPSRTVRRTQPHSHRARQSRQRPRYIPMGPTGRIYPRSGAFETCSMRCDIGSHDGRAAAAEGTTTASLAQPGV